MAPNPRSKGVHIGGSRAMRVASDYHAARLVFQNVGEPGADYESLPLLIPFWQLLPDRLAVVCWIKSDDG
jgi:hypothetical protein